MSNSTFPKQVRLLRPAEFERVFANRSSVADAMLVVYGLPNGLGHARLGATVSRKVGRAVTRNRWKRLLREAFRLTQHQLPALDLVCLPQPRSVPDLRRLMASLPALAIQLNQKHADRLGSQP